MNKIFDWNKAAKLIVENKPQAAYAGLIEDWFWTGGIIFNGEVVPKEDTYTYLGSFWATPVLILEFSDKPDEVFDCYVKMEEVTAECHAGTYWPEEAVKILTEGLKR